jgi:hypothetical protein
MDYPQHEQTLPSFDELMELAEHNPEAFDELKREICEEAITYATEEMQPRLRAQQTHIDRVIRRCKNPYQTNVILMRELTLQMEKFQSALEGEFDEGQVAEVIPFNRRHH